MTINIDPVLLQLGPLQIRWYGLMYVVGFLVGGKILAYLSDKGFFKISKDKIDLFITYLLIGMFLGARLAYVFIYNWDYYSQNLDEIFSVWHGGLSFHGALVGMITAAYLFARKNKLHFFHIGDCMAIAGTPGLFFGRLGNFINGELYGRVTDAPWGMIFKDAGPYPRHPSQLYEGIMEGIFLFIIFWFMAKKVKNYGVLTSLFLIGYGLARFLVEFFREPDSQLGYYFGGTTTMGQILCFIMIAGGVLTWFYARKVNLPVKR